MLALGSEDPHQFRPNQADRPAGLPCRRLRTADAPLAELIHISDGLRDAMARWLDHLRAVDGVAENTITAYQRDLAGFLAFLGGHFGDSLGQAPLARLTISDMRAWMAHERGRGVAARSLARELSAVKNFAGWMAERDGFDASAILAARAPKYRRKLPRPLPEDAAKAVIDTVELQSDEPWVAARDVAVVTLLYGCGLRISEALGLDGAVLPLGEALRIRGKGGKERIVPLLPAARSAVERYVALCPFSTAPAIPSFAASAAGRSTRGWWPR